MDHYDQSICFYAVLLCLMDFDMIAIQTLSAMIILTSSAMEERLFP